MISMIVSRDWMDLKNRFGGHSKFSKWCEPCTMTYRFLINSYLGTFSILGARSTPPHPIRNISGVMTSPCWLNIWHSQLSPTRAQHPRVLTVHHENSSETQIGIWNIWNQGTICLLTTIAAHLLVAKNWLALGPARDKTSCYRPPISLFKMNSFDFSKSLVSTLDLLQNGRRRNLQSGIQ